MDAEGHLIIPDDSELSRFCPVDLPMESSKRLAEWRIQYPRPKIDETSPAPAPAPAPPAGGAEPPGPGDSFPAGTPPPGVEASLPAGTMKPNLEAVSAIGDTIINQISLPDGTPASLKDIHLSLAKTKQDGRHIWIHNVSGTKDVVVPSGTYVGKGGRKFLFPHNRQHSGRQGALCWEVHAHHWP